MITAKTKNGIVVELFFDTIEKAKKQNPYLKDFCYRA